MAGSALNSTHPVDHYRFARQAIYDTENDLFGCELLYRPLGPSDKRVSGETATAQVLSSCLTDTDYRSLLRTSRCFFINMTRDHLLNLHLAGLPHKNVVYEILEGIEVDQLLTNRLAELKDKGYSFALDDFSLDCKNSSLIQYADYVKLDVQNLCEKTLALHVKMLRNSGPNHLRLVAEKIETQAELDLCRSLGFDLFQGYFLSM